MEQLLLSLLEIFNFMQALKLQIVLSLKDSLDFGSSYFNT